MEVLTEEESHLVMESMTPPFTKQPLDDHSSSPLSESDQNVLMIHVPGQEYKLTQNHRISSLNAENEILVKVTAMGLNPIDWKGLE